MKDKTKSDAPRSEAPQRVESLARDIYLRLSIGPAAAAKVPAELVRQAFEKARAFYEFADKLEHKEGQ